MIKSALMCKPLQIWLSTRKDPKLQSKSQLVLSFFLLLYKSWLKYSEQCLSNTSEQHFLSSLDFQDAVCLGTRLMDRLFNCIEYVYIYMHVCVCMCVCIYMYRYVYICMCMRICVRVCIYVYMCVCIHIYIYIYIYIFYYSFIYSLFTFIFLSFLIPLFLLLFSILF